VTLTELLTYAEGTSPWLVTALVILGAVGYATERATGLVGPITKLLAAWRDRELRKLRREALIRAERRRIEQEEESARLSALREEVQWLRAEVARLLAHQCTPDSTGAPRTSAIPAARNPARVPVPRR
jgi:hypothetical protein